MWSERVKSVSPSLSLNNSNLHSCFAVCLVCLADVWTLKEGRVMELVLGGRAVAEEMSLTEVVKVLERLQLW